MSNRTESLKTKIERWGFNRYPAIRATGGKITLISADYSHVEVKLPLNRRSKNYVGTIFGGSMFSLVDPVYMVMLYKILGKEFSVWVKSAHIDFLKPGRSTLYAVFHLPSSDIEKLKEDVAANGKTVRELQIELKDDDGSIHAVVRQCLFISLKRPVE